MRRMSENIGRLVTVLLGSALVAATTGCSDGHPANELRMQRGYVYYLDGAGGGGTLKNYSSGVRSGLLDAGYDGAGEMFPWETGMGLMADQTASNEYKRGKARALAEAMVEYRQAHPDAPMTVIGLSAGTVIAVFALEALPPDIKVENVILLSGSLSATYDLTAALEHVNGKMYVTTSDRDAVLGALLPLTGTADRGSGTNETIGVEGPMLPPNAPSQTRDLYQKLRIVPWKKEFEKYGDYGRHTDTVAAGFVAHYIAPLITTTSGAQFALAAGPAEAGTVSNPGYDRWARFAPGAWVVLEGTETIDGVTRPLRMKTTLMSKSPDMVVFQREEISSTGQAVPSRFAQTLYESARVMPADSPMTSRSAQVRQLPERTIRVGSRELQCEGRSISATGDFTAWGSNPEATVYTSYEIPSGIAELDIKTHLGQQSLSVKGKVTDYGINQH